MKDAKFARPEAEGIRVLLAGLRSTDSDEQRLERGAAIFTMFERKRSRMRGGRI
jgi:hypothetical protein